MKMTGMLVGNNLGKVQALGQTMWSNNSLLSTGLSVSEGCWRERKVEDSWWTSLQLNLLAIFKSIFIGIPTGS